MNRKALSERIQGLSEVFASDNPIYQDLQAMSYVLSEMDDEKFASIVNPEFTAEKEATTFTGTPGQVMPARPTGQYDQYSSKPTKSVPADVLGDLIAIWQDATIPHSDKLSLIDQVKAMAQKAETAIKSDAQKVEKGVVPGLPGSGAPASTRVPGLMTASEEDSEGIFWTKEASASVRDFLLKDVVGMDKSICCDTGRALEKVEMPDGDKKPEAPATLTKEQIPSIKETLDSKIVEKADAAKPVNKDAGKQPKDKVIKNIEKQIKILKKDDGAEEAKKEATASNHEVEGIELAATDMDASLSSDEASELAKLFN